MDRLDCKYLSVLQALFVHVFMPEDMYLDTPSTCYDHLFGDIELTIKYSVSTQRHTLGWELPLACRL